MSRAPIIPTHTTATIWALRLGIRTEVLRGRAALPIHCGSPDSHDLTELCAGTEFCLLDQEAAEESEGNVLLCAGG